MLKALFDTTYHDTKVIARVFDWSGDTVTHTDTILSYDNVDQFTDYDINCIVASKKNEIIVELA